MIRFRWKRKPILFPGRPYEDFTDIGGGNQIRLVYDDDTNEPIMLVHYCLDPDGNDHIASFDVSIHENKGYDKDAPWFIQQLVPLSVTPSIWIKEIRHHGYITNGVWDSIAHPKYVSVWARDKYRSRSRAIAKSRRYLPGPPQLDREGVCDPEVSSES